MTLAEQDIKKILEDRPNKPILTKAQGMLRVNSVHVLGVGMDSYIAQINSFENKDQYEARKKYARSNKDLFDRVLRPMDNVFSAKGGSTYFDMPEEQSLRLRGMLMNVENGLSLRKWIEEYWLKAYIVDPMGLVFIEVGDNEAYPTYKSSSSIVDYQLNGRNLDYVIFSTSDKDKYRVVDDAWDRIVTINGEELTTDKSNTYPNYFGFVPAILNSDIPVFGTEEYQSPIHQVVEIADEYLRECSVKSVYKLLHGFPKSWAYASICDKCGGEKFIEGEKCPSCKGTGFRLKWDIADTKIISPPESREDPVIAPNVGGYITPDLDTWDKMTDELKLLENIIFYTIWGTRQREDAENETATGRFIDTQPVNSRLSKISETAEGVERFIADAIGRFSFPATYKGSSINYGRRYLIESPDVIWDKYEKARREGAPTSVLDSLLEEYVQSRYQANSLELAVQLKKIKIEPFVHYTIEQVKLMDIQREDYLKKAYLSDFFDSLESSDILTLSPKQLESKLTQYVQLKL